MAIIPPKIPLIPGNMRKGKPIPSPLPTIPLIGKQVLPKGKPVPWRDPDKLTNITPDSLKGIVPNFSEPASFAGLRNVLSSFNSGDGYAQPNRFEVIITAPPRMSGSTVLNASTGSARKLDARSVSMRCESVTLPGRNLNTLNDTNIYGPTREVVDGVAYAEDIAMTFQASSGLAERVFFEEWQKQAFNEETWNIGYYNDYTSTIEIYLLDRQNQKRYGLKLYEAYPKTITGTDLNQGTNNEIIKIAVNFSFRYWKNIKTETNTNNVSLGFENFSGLGATIQKQENQPAAAKLLT